MQNHIIVCGFCHNGKRAVQKLIAYKRPFVVLEKDKDVVDRFSDEDTLFGARQCH